VLDFAGSFAAAVEDGGVLVDWALADAELAVPLLSPQAAIDNARTRTAVVFFVVFMTRL
jgi:hypothetical protein